LRTNYLSNQVDKGQLNKSIREFLAPRTVIRITVRPSQMLYLSTVQKVRCHHMYRVLVQIHGDEYIFVASRAELDEAIRLVDGLRIYWPREYVVRDSEGNEIDLTGCAELEPERGTASPVS
jgi:hypothetical protein